MKRCNDCKTMFINNDPMNYKCPTCGGTGEEIGMEYDTEGYPIYYDEMEVEEDEMSNLVRIEGKLDALISTLVKSGILNEKDQKYINDREKMMLDVLNRPLLPFDYDYDYDWHEHYDPDDIFDNYEMCPFKPIPNESEDEAEEEFELEAAPDDIPISDTPTTDSDDDFDDTVPF